MDSPRGIHYAWVILPVSLMVVFGALGLARFGYSVVLPAMQTGLEMKDTGAGVLASANLAGYLALAVVGGALAARFGPRRVIAAGLAVVGIGMIMTGFSRGFAEAALWRAITGLGSGASNVPVMGLLPAWFAARRRGFAAGIGVAGSSVGLIVVGPLAPRILEAYGPLGWRVCWWIFGGATLLLAVLAYALLRNRPADLGLAPLGADETAPPAPSPSGGLAWGSVYRSPIMWQVGAVYVAFGFSYMIYMTFFVKWVIAGGGYSPAEAGRLFMTMGAVSLLCGLIWGTMSDVIGRKWALVIVYLIHAISFGLFGLWPTPAGLTISAVLFGLTAWSIPAIMAAACGDLLGPRLAPAGLGFVTLFFGIGQALGPSVAGAVADAATFGHAAGSANAAAHSLGPAFVLAAAVAFLGAVGAALLPKELAARHR